ncbi:TnpV protein [Thiolapillus sp.]|nr:TnpV protein [Thiolapillus sp.]
MNLVQATMKNPSIKILPTPKTAVTGRYGKVILEHLKTNQVKRYRKMQKNGTLQKYLAEQEQRAREQIADLMPKLFDSLILDAQVMGKDTLNYELRHRLMNTAHKEAEMTILGDMAPGGLSRL